MARHIAFDYRFLTSRASVVGLAAALMVSACATTQAPAPRRDTGPVVQRPVPQPPVQRPDPRTKPDTKPAPDTGPRIIDRPTDVVSRDGVTPPHMAGRNIKRLALLLPFSAKSSRLRAEAQSMLQAAEMAVFDNPDNDVLLIALDSQGTSGGAKTAARAANEAGADVILGPILADSVRAAGREARKENTPVIAFSTDQTIAGGGVYLLSFPPEAEVRRVVEYAASEGASRFAYLGPDNEYGRRALSEYRNSVARTGGAITAQESYKGNDISVMQAPATKLANLYVETERASGGNGNLAFEAVLMPEGGTALRSLAPLLPYNRVNPEIVQFMGTGLWHREDTVREPALDGGIFAGPDQDTRRQFTDSFDRAYGSEPTTLASLAYDAVLVGGVIADGDPRGRRARAEDPQGFYGADGLIRFNPDGTPDRGMAIYRIEDGRFVIIDPAPKTSMGPS